MLWQEFKIVFFVLEFEPSKVGTLSNFSSILFSGSSQIQKLYLYDSDFKQSVVGAEISKALRFSSAELAVTYLGRNEAVRSIRGLVRVERVERFLRKRDRRSTRIA